MVASQVAVPFSDAKIIIRSNYHSFFLLFLQTFLLFFVKKVVRSSSSGDERREAAHSRSILNRQRAVAIKAQPLHMEWGRAGDEGFSATASGES